ncbi:unnamed protein product [Rhizophagus irregularis]|nr:unnamed protein product [Rhizophagus irregularis]
MLAKSHGYVGNTWVVKILILTFSNQSFLEHVFILMRWCSYMNIMFTRVLQDQVMAANSNIPAKRWF